MTGIKHRLLRFTACLWEGHIATLGTSYSVVLGRRVECVCCLRCHKVL